VLKTLLIRRDKMEIRLKNITKIFVQKDKTEVMAVKSLDIVIPSGKLIGL